MISLLPQNGQGFNSISGMVSFPSTRSQPGARPDETGQLIVIMYQQHNRIPMLADPACVVGFYRTTGNAMRGLAAILLFVCRMRPNNFSRHNIAPSLSSRRRQCTSVNLVRPTMLTNRSKQGSLRSTVHLRVICSKIPCFPCTL